MIGERLMQKIIKTTGDWTNKNTAITDMFYMLPALTTAYTIEGSEYIDMTKAVEYTYSDFENNRVKVKDGVTDALVSGVLCRKVNGEIKHLNEVIDSYEQKTFEQIKDDVAPVIEFVKSIEIYVGMHGVEVSYGKTDFDVSVECYQRGQLMGKVSTKATNQPTNAMLCASHLIAKHEVLAIRVVIDACDYTVILANRADGTSGALIFGEKVGACKATLEQIGADLGDLDAVRSSN